MESGNLIDIELDISGFYFVKWPELKIYHNDQLIYDKEIVERQTIKLELLNCLNFNNLKIVHYNKSFGDSGIWHTDGTNECWMQINDIKFNDVSVGGRFINELEFETDWTQNQLVMHDEIFISKYNKFLCDGKLTFNGKINFNFETPIYNWLIIKKFKRPVVSASYFSNTSKLWHYEEERGIIEDIKRIMNFK